MWTPSRWSSRRRGQQLTLRPPSASSHPSSKMVRSASAGSVGKQCALGEGLWRALQHGLCCGLWHGQHRCACSELALLWPAHAGLQMCIAVATHVLQQEQGGSLDTEWPQCLITVRLLPSSPY